MVLFLESVVLGLCGEMIHYNQQINLILWNLIRHAQEAFLLRSYCWHKSFSRWILFQLSGVFINFYVFYFGARYSFLQNHCSIYTKRQYRLPLWYIPGEQLLQFWITMHQYMNMISPTWQKKRTEINESSLFLNVVI